MSRLNRIICRLAALVCAAEVTGVAAQPAGGAASTPPSSVQSRQAGAPLAVEKECVDVNDANVCWLIFTDGTRCVVANNAEGGDSSTAINCHFSTPMERLHRMPKD